MAKIYYIGDWAVQLGPVYAETSFSHTPKGLDFINYGHWLVSAVESSGRHEIKSVPTWDFYNMPPGAYEEVLDEYDVIVFSDVEAKNFQLNPQFFDRHLFGTKVLTFPDRVRLTVEAVHAGKHIIFMGGWLSFNGEMGKGGWGRTGLRDILPCECLEVEDLRESTEGFTAEAILPDHPILNGIDLATMPPVLGYNIVTPRPGSDVIARWQPDGHPAITAGQFGAGRTVAYTSDPAPHWGLNFVFWQQYAALWTNICDWLVAEPAASSVEPSQIVEAQTVEEAPAVVSLQAVMGEMETVDDQITAYLNIRTGDLISLSEDDMGLAEKESLDNLPEWQQEFAQLVDDVLNSNHYLALPSQFDIHEYAIMKDFCYTVEDEELSAKLLHRISGRGAFRYFKDTIYEYDIVDKWYAFRAAAFKKIAIDWLEDSKVPYNDDIFETS